MRGDARLFVSAWGTLKPAAEHREMVTTAHNPAPASDLLEAAYRQLEFDQGALLSAARAPQSAAMEDWIDRGDWQSLAAQVGAERIFFVDRDPVVVFAKTEDRSHKRFCGRSTNASGAWPVLSFCSLRVPGQLSVFDLTKPPPKPDESSRPRSSDRRCDLDLPRCNQSSAPITGSAWKRASVFGEDRFSQFVEPFRPRAYPRPQDGPGATGDIAASPRYKATGLAASSLADWPGHFHPLSRRPRDSSARHISRKSRHDARNGQKFSLNLLPRLRLEPTARWKCAFFAYCKTRISPTRFSTSSLRISTATRFRSMRRSAAVSSRRISTS